MGIRNTLAAAIMMAMMISATQAQEAVGNTPKDQEQQATEATNLEGLQVQAKFLDVGAKSAMKMEVAVMDTPMSVQSYGQAFMDAVDTRRLTDLYGYMTGVQMSGNTGTDLSIRGFEMGGSDRNSVMVDGLPGVSSRFGSPSTATLQSVEVVKGPMAVLYGRGQPGGFVNMITKKPEASRSTTVELRPNTYISNVSHFGSDLGISGVLDTTGPIFGDRDTWLYRAIVEYDDSDSFRDDVYDKTFLVAPSLTWNVSDATSATLALEYRDRKAAYDAALVAPDFDYRLIAPRNTHYQEPGDTQNEKGRTVSLAVSHAFNDNFTWNLNARSVWTEDHTSGFNSNTIAPDKVTLRRQDREQVNVRDYNFIDNTLASKFSTGFLDHQMLLGATAGRASTDFDRRRFTTSKALDINIYHPVYGAKAPPSPPHSHAISNSDSYSVYATDLITLSPHWKVLLGVRHEVEDQDTQEVRLASSAGKQTATFKKTLPLAGLLYQPSELWTIYGSYSTSFVPPAPEFVPLHEGTRLVAESASQIETGAKFQSRDGRSTATLALFQINKKNELQSIATPDGNRYDQVGKSRSRGAELEVNVRPTNAWQLTGGYSYIDASVTADVIKNRVGAMLTNAPKHSVSFLSRYSFAEGALKNFGFGVGTVYRSDRAGTLPTAATTRYLTLPAYTTLDLALYYNNASIDASLKLSNALDEVYYQSAYGVQRVNPGRPRQLSLNVRKHFF